MDSVPLKVKFRRLIGKYSAEARAGEWGNHSISLNIEASGNAVFEERFSQFRDSEDWLYKVGRVSVSNDIITFVESRKQGESMGPGGNRSYHEKVITKRFRRLAGGSLALLGPNGESRRSRPDTRGSLKKRCLSAGTRKSRP